jgi:hypothetical protein
MQHSAGPAQLAGARVGWRFKPRRQLGPNGQPAQEAKEVWDDGDRPIKSQSTAPSCLLSSARTNRAETLALRGRRRSSPRGLLRPWGGDEGTWQSSVSSTRGGGGGSLSSLMTCTLVTRPTTRWCLMGSRLGLPWVKRKVGLVSYGLGECKQAEIEGVEGLDWRHSSPLPCIKN